MKGSRYASSLWVLLLNALRNGLVLPAFPLRLLHLCIGNTFALTEILLCATIESRYQLLLGDGHIVVLDLRPALYAKSVFLTIHTHKQLVLQVVR